ncbi:MAG: metallophosphoesterase [Nitrososphaerota archaeon]|nr:metallophosphoesterase [Nitrososphaerota archaeon]MDG7037731.1 metallophosphoesterase [Nitrososphaerota archaeon]
MKTRVFFVSDLHGSDRCFRKFINGGRFYSADVLILGGDISGKTAISILRMPDGTWKCVYAGKEHIMKNHEEVEGMSKSIRDSGYYPYITDEKEVEELTAKPAMIEALFKKLAKDSIGNWIKLAEERLRGSEIKCYISPGNDDPLEIDETLNSSDYVVNPEGKVVNIDGHHQMITVGYTNYTPWHTPRELDEKALGEMIEKLAQQVKGMSNAIFNFHAPPINSLIDQAPKLDEDLKPVIIGGNVVMAPAGSTAVRESIERYQPLVGLHGHIHEARGVVKIGRTTCFNPGSECASGVLRGLILDLEEDRIKSYALTRG